MSRHAPEETVFCTGNTWNLPFAHAEASTKATCQVQGAVSNEEDSDKAASLHVQTLKEASCHS
eukprot:8987187-Prorocentrum_lima.AAC.1